MPAESLTDRATERYEAMTPEQRSKHFTDYLQSIEDLTAIDEFLQALINGQPTNVTLLKQRIDDYLVDQLADEIRDEDEQAKIADRIAQREAA